MRLLICVLFLSGQFTSGFSQSVSISGDGSAAHSSSMLEIKSTSKGLLIPRMTLAQRNAIGSPATGLMIYQTDNTPGFYFFDGINWSGIGGISTNGWALTGNAGTNPATHFIGTSDNQPLRFRLNNLWAGELNAGSRNIFFGDSSGFSTTSGTLNTSLGSKTLKVNTTGLGNTAIGSNALNHHYMSNTTAVGSYALYNNTYGVTNLALGYSALRQNTIGSYNTALGFESLRQNVDGSDNTGIGYQALYWNTASYNTAIGTSCLAFNTTGINNTAIGMNALYANTTGHENTAVGRDALVTSTTAIENVSIGYQSMASNTWGSLNTAVGTWALHFNTNSSYNTAIGYKALYFNWASENTAVGYKSMYFNDNGVWNVAMGLGALDNNTNGNSNTAIGWKALTNNVTGDANVAIGKEAGTNGSYSTTIGIGNQGYLINSNLRVHIGGPAATWIGGQVSWSTYSDLRIKNNIREDVPGVAFINRLRPVTYYKDIDLQLQLTRNKPLDQSEHSRDIEQIKFSGFLAQEVEQAALEAGYDFSGITAPKHEHDLYTLSYESFVVPLVKAVQEQQMMIETSKQKEENFQSIILHQQQKIDDLEARLIEIEKLIGNGQSEKGQ